MKAIRRIILLSLMFPALLSCSRITERADVRADCGVRLCIGEEVSRSDDPDEEAVWDLNVFAYNGYGLLEVHEYIQLRSPARSFFDIPLNLVPGREYDIFAFVNSGYRLDEMSRDELLGLEFYMAYPDEYSHGMPMAGRISLSEFHDGDIVELPVRRLMSKISITVDRSALDRDVSFVVSSVRIGGCPRKVAPFKESSSCASVLDFFSTGFHKNGEQVSNLNQRLASGISLSADLFMLENVRDGFDPDLCSYVEMCVDYISDSLQSAPGGIVYRFYLRENDDYCVRRNSHYKITVCPRGSGIMCEDEWRLDKYALDHRQTKSFMTISPSGSVVDGVYYPNYYEMPADSSMHFSLDYAPSGMKVYLREDLVKDELDDARAQYVMDPDGRGFTVRGLSRECLSIMEIIAEDPLDDSETIVIGLTSGL